MDSTHHEDDALDPTDDTTVGRPPATKRRSRSRLRVVILVAVTLMAGSFTLVANPSTASAATTGWAGGTVCYKAPVTLQYNWGTYTVVGNYQGPVEVQFKYDGRWLRLATVYTNSAGCAWSYVPTAWEVRFVAKQIDTVDGRTDWWQAIAGPYAGLRNGTYNYWFGTHQLERTRTLS
jgi:hypothetical protein